jgi:hypothetical protein
MLQITEESEAAIRQAEHNFCVAVDLKVDPNTYDGKSCFNCIIGQLVLAEHLGVKQDSYMIRPDAPNFETWAEDFGYTDDYLAFHEYRQEFGIDVNEFPTLVAEHFKVDEHKVKAIWLGVTGGNDDGYFVDEVRNDLERAKKDVVAAYMNCDYGPSDTKGPSPTSYYEDSEWDDEEDEDD